MGTQPAPDPTPPLWPNPWKTSPTPAAFRRASWDRLRWPKCPVTSRSWVFTPQDMLFFCLESPQLPGPPSGHPSVFQS